MCLPSIQTDRESAYPTDHDVQACVEVYRRILSSLTVEDFAREGGGPMTDTGGYVIDGEEWWPYDGPVTVCLSVGHCEVWSDGEVAGGPATFWVDCDGQEERV